MPAEDLGGSDGGDCDLRHVTWPARPLEDRDGPAGDGLRDRDDLSNGRAAARAEVQARRGPATA
jgi:hypothetical protein